MAIPQTGTEPALDSTNPAAPVVPPVDEMATPQAPAQEAALDQDQDAATTTVDLDAEMKIPADDTVAGVTQPAEVPIDPNAELKNGNGSEHVVEGSTEPAPVTMPEPVKDTTPEPSIEPTLEPAPAMTPEPVMEPAPMMESTDNKIAEPVEEKVTLDKLPELAAEQPEEQPAEQPVKVEPAEPVHEVPNQDKLEEIMAAPTQPEDTGLPSLDEKVEMDKAQKKPGKKGGSGGMMQIVLIFLILAILAASAILAYMLFM
ncbi:hypothetical protein JW978_03985 [Candidatus Dojkabacteria bacterium]|nr:hypothetical protein [Candidatus Dojkabacteria bacterium]